MALNRLPGLVPDLVPAVLAGVERQVPEVRGAPWRDQAAEVAWLTFELSRSMELADRGGIPNRDDLERFASHYRAAARRGVPMRTMQRFCRATVAQTLTELWARAQPEDVTDLLRLSRWIARHNRALERLLVRVYCELLDTALEDVEHREALAVRLLAGVGPDDRVDVATASGYLVAVLDSGSGELPPWAIGAVLDGQQHLIVVVAPGERREDAWSSLARWVADGGALRAAGAFCDSPAEVPATVGATLGLLRAAVAVDLSGLVSAQDLVLESVLVAQPDAARGLAGLLEPLERDERLLTTLVVFFANDLDRTATAAQLFLSRGGLALRLDRITQVTGLDPRLTRGIQVLGAALTARALRPAAGEPDQSA